MSVHAQNISSKIFKFEASQADLRKKIHHYLHSDEDTIVWVSSDLKNTFFKLKKYLSGQRDFQGVPTVLLILADKPAQKFEIKVKNRVTKEETANVLGYLPGSTKPEEYVIFSAHYDHLGIDTMLERDTIYNGANDDASGTTAVIALTRYFEKHRFLLLS
jgi:Zn-dependent M28 family amino/carboxypeptidase